MKLYYSKGACSLAVRIIIHELGIPSEFEAVDLATKKTESGADFLKINPKGAVPTLVLDNHEVLTENAVIQQYLADHYKGTQLLPSIGDFKRYRVLEWLNFASSDLHKGFGPLFNPKVPENLKEEIFKPLLKKRFDHVNQHLGHHTYLTGNQFTLGDSYLFITLRWLAHFYGNLSQWPHLQRYFNEVHKRPAVQQSLKEEAL